jgi:glycosyltransferase involved in cell wall biosynthesis
MLRSSDAVVAISEDFSGLLIDDYGLDAASVSVIENWAGLDEIPVRPHSNDWAERNGLVDCRVVLYAGTLGMKHRPELLVELASSFLGRPEMRIVVASEGLGADWLLAQKAALGLDNLMVLGFQPYTDLPDMLGTADILTVVLESDAGVFSVPSKVLTYLCAGRPLLAALPSENLAARIISRCGAGVLVTSNDTAAFVKEAEALIEDDDLRYEMGRRARSYAEDTFDIERITDRFEAVFNGHHDSQYSVSVGLTVAAGRENH